MPDEQEYDGEAEMVTHNLDMKLGVWLDAAFERFGGDDRFAFMLTVAMQPPPAPHLPPSPTPAVVFWMPGPVIGTVMAGQFLFDNPCGIDRVTVEDMVRNGCEQMRAARSQQLSQLGNGHGPAGPGAPPNPLIIP